MAQENKTLEDYVKALYPVYKTESAKDLLKQYNRDKTNPEADQTSNYQTLGILVGNDPRTFIDQPESGMLLRLHEWQESEEPNVNAAVNQYKDQIFNEYVGLLNKNIKETVDEFKSKIKNPTEEDFKRLEIELYKIMGRKIRELPMGNAYAEKNPEVYAIIKNLETIESLSKGDRDKLKSAVTKARGLPEIFSSAPVANIWTKEYLAQEDAYTRTIGKTFLQGSNGNYSINVNELKNYTTNKEKDKETISLDAYKRMGRDVYEPNAEKLKELKDFVK